MKKTALLFVFFSLFLLSSTLSANERLNFQQPDSFKENQISNFIKSQKNASDSPYLLAAIDLNGDFIDEYILRPQNSNDCEQAKLCPYYIAAFQDRAPILIGQFDAHKIVIYNKKTYWIRQIIVYNDLYNDFKTATAIWDPFSFRFKL